MRGFVVNGFAQDGIDLDGASNTTVEGNYIGTGVSGTVALPNEGGVKIDSGATGNTIGGLTNVPGTGAGNLISGNSGDGVELSGAGTTSNVVEGNLIGTDFTGKVAVRNNTGVNFDSGTSGNTLGGLTALARNVISGNTTYGVDLTTASSANVVLGNYVGTDITGDASLSNYMGILVQGIDNTIGGTGSGAGNVISGNDETGSFFAGTQLAVGNAFDFDTTGNLVEGNLIGLGANGQVIAGSTNGGVYLAAFSSGNTVGGTTPAARNVISGNQVGVYLVSDSGNVVEGNFIGTDTTGTVAIGNGTIGENEGLGGIVVQANSGDTIGGTASGAGNVISGNQNAGVYVFDSSSGDVFEGNLIGTNAAGTAAVPNIGNGVEISGDEGGSFDFTIGGATAGAGNLISGNTGDGVDFVGSNVVVQGNLIGADKSGTVAIPNFRGIDIEGGSSGITIGGTTAVARNVVSGNSAYGVELRPGSSDIVVEGNYVGTDAGGTAALPNYFGVELDGGASGNTIGGLTASRGTCSRETTPTGSGSKTPRPTILLWVTTSAPTKPA